MNILFKILAFAVAIFFLFMYADNNIYRYQDRERAKYCAQKTLDRKERIEIDAINKYWVDNPTMEFLVGYYNLCVGQLEL